MSEYRELRTISLDFRRISSNLLSSDDGDADVNLHRLMDYIEKTPFIHDRVHSVVDQVEYDFQACFPTHSSEWASTSIPVDENCHIKAIYDYMRYIVETPNTNVLGQAMQYLSSAFSLSSTTKQATLSRRFLNSSLDESKKSKKSFVLLLNSANELLQHRMSTSSPKLYNSFNFLAGLIK